jgi:hypothetical protein
MREQAIVRVTLFFICAIEREHSRAYGVLKPSETDELPENEKIDSQHAVSGREPVPDSYGRL